MPDAFNDQGFCIAPEALIYEGNDCEASFYVAEQNAGYSWGYYLRTAANHIYVWPYKPQIVATAGQAGQQADRDATALVDKLEGWGRPWIHELRVALAELRAQSGHPADVVKAVEVLPTLAPVPEKQYSPGHQLSLF